MIYSAIKKRTQEVNKQLNQVWCKKWMKYVEHHPEHPWDWSGISHSSSLTMEYVERHPEHPWDWSGISQSSSLTMEYVEQHPEHPWDWSGISQNDLKKEKNTFIEKKYREHLSAFKIQQWFYHIKLNPNYNYCRKRVNMIYDRYLS